MAGIPNRRLRAGIVGIEREIEEKQLTTSRNISQAFEDLSNLMTMAKDMVNTAKRISEKMRARTGAISDDETIQFKSYLLSLGVDDPVTREGSKSMYFADLANEISRILVKPIRESGGVMVLTDAYCRVNRARGLELISPADILDACVLMEPMKLPIRLVKFRSGVMVLQLADFNDEAAAEETERRVQENVALSAEEFARISGLPVVLAKERLLMAEQYGRLCRDETIEGLRFYPNYIVNQGGL